MKKYLLSILAALPMVFAFSACSDDDNDLPDVDFDFTFENAVVSDGTVYFGLLFEPECLSTTG